MKMLAAVLLTLFILAIIGSMYSRTMGYQARVKAWSTRQSIAAHAASEVAKIEVATKQWQAQVAREDFERTRRRLIDEAETNSTSPLRRVL